MLRPLRVQVGGHLSVDVVEISLRHHGVPGFHGFKLLAQCQEAVSAHVVRRGDDGAQHPLLERCDAVVVARQLHARQAKAVDQLHLRGIQRNAPRVVPAHVLRQLVQLRLDGVRPVVRLFQLLREFLFDERALHGVAFTHAYLINIALVGRGDALVHIRQVFTSGFRCCDFAVRLLPGLLGFPASHLSVAVTRAVARAVARALHRRLVSHRDIAVRHALLPVGLVRRLRRFHDCAGRRQLFKHAVELDVLAHLRAAPVQLHADHGGLREHVLVAGAHHGDKGAGGILRRPVFFASQIAHHAVDAVTVDALVRLANHGVVGDRLIGVALEQLLHLIRDRVCALHGFAAECTRGDVVLHPRLLALRVNLHAAALCAVQLHGRVLSALAFAPHACLADGGFQVVARRHQRSVSIHSLAAALLRFAPREELRQLVVQAHREALLHAQQVIHNRLASALSPRAHGVKQLFRRRRHQLAVHVVRLNRYACLRIARPQLIRVALHRVLVAAVGRLKRRVLIGRIAARALHIVRQLVHDHLAHHLAGADPV